MPEQQLVEIARALGAEARILIMDEPTASLSDKEVDRLFRVIGELKAAGGRHHLHLASPRRAAAGRRPRDGLARRRAGRDAADGRGHPRRADPHDGRPRALGRLSQDVRGAGRGGPRGPRAWAAGRRACTDVDLQRSSRRDPGAGRPGRRGADRAGAGPLRPDAGRLGRDPAARPAGGDRFAGARGRAGDRATFPKTAAATA